MGVLGSDVAFLVALRALGVSFERGLTIGRQELHTDAVDLRAGFAESGARLSRERAAEIVAEPHRFADRLFAELGTRQLDCLDASDYEGCNVIHDLNTPAPDYLRERYS